MENKLILGIDTSTNNCSAGLIKDGNIISQKSEFGKSIHSEKLLDFVDELFINDITMRDIDAIAITIGPGSYTGLRIGLSTAKGLAFPLGIPVLPVPTFKVLENVARQEWQHEKILLFIKSHRDLVYYTVAAMGEQSQVFPKVLHEPIGHVLTKNPAVQIICGNSDFEISGNRKIHIRYPNGIQTALLGEKHYSELINRTGTALEPEYHSEFKAVKWKP